MTANILRTCGPAFLMAFCATCVRASSIFITDNENNRILRADLDGSDLTAIVTTELDIPVPIASDTIGQRIYWADQGLDKIESSDFKGLGRQRIAPPPSVTSPDGIAVDGAAGHVYWTDFTQDDIWRTDLDGGNPVKLVDSGIPGIRAIALHVSGGKMYWTDVSTDKISRADLDGTNVEDVFLGGNPVDVVIHPGFSKMYWVDNGTNKLFRADLDGSNSEELLSTTRPLSIDLDLLNNKIYWTTGNGFGLDNAQVHRANLDGTNPETIIDLPTGQFQGIAVAVPEPEARVLGLVGLVVATLLCMRRFLFAQTLSG